MKKIFTLICTILIAISASAGYSNIYNYKCGPTEVVVTDLSTPTYNQFKLVITQKAKNTANYRSPITVNNTVELILQPEQHSIVGTFTTDDYTIDANSFLISGNDSLYVSYWENSTITIVSKGGNKYAITDGLLQVESSDRQDLYKYDYCYVADDLNNQSAPETPFEFTIEEAPAPVTRKEFTFVAGEVAEADPAVIAITWGADGSSETVKMTKKENDIYVADILPTVDSVVLVRCAPEATEINWEQYVWNQTEKYPLSDTMYFGGWVEETNLFTLTSPKPVEGDQFVDATSGLKFEVTAVGEANTVKVINNDYPGTSYTVPGTVTYREKTFDVTEIGVEAFHDCSSLESITLPESVTTLAYSSLSTSGLKSITIPATVTTIGEYAFAGCRDLQSVTFQGNACQDTIGDNAFEDVGTTTTPATLTLPDDWAGSTPENSETPWYGGYFDYDAPAPEYKYTEYENWQLKYLKDGNTWEWSDDMEKVEDGLFKLADVDWKGSGFNVKSDENPIKKDWFAPEELVIGDECIAPVTVDVYLQVIDDETVKIGVGVIPVTDPVWPEDAPTTAPADPTVDGASILGAALTTSYAFEPQDWPGAMPQLLTFETGETIYYMEGMTWQIYTNWDEDSYDVSKYNTLHVDLYPATGTEIKVTFEGLNVEDGGQGYKNSVVKTLTAGQWNALDIALSEFPALTSGDPYDFSDIRYFILEGYDAEHTALTVGNVYFYSNSTALPKVDKTGITVNGRKYGFPVRLVKEVK